VKLKVLLHDTAANFNLSTTLQLMKVTVLAESLFFFCIQAYCCSMAVYKPFSGRCHVFLYYLYIYFVSANIIFSSMNMASEFRNKMFNFAVIPLGYQGIHLFSGELYFKKIP
jgi:hypothetical protein